MIWVKALALPWARLDKRRAFVRALSFDPVAILTHTPIDPANPDKDLSVGIPDIDDEHRVFFADVHRLERALSAREHMASLRQVMNRLVENALAHFAHEERLFAEYRYPEVDEHVRIHATPAEELTRLRQEFEIGDFRDEWISVAAKLKEILMNHLVIHDMKYRDFLHRYRLLPV